MEIFREFMEDVEKTDAKLDYKERIDKIIVTIEDLLGEENPICIYPKNIFLERMDLKFIVFLEDRILVADFNEYYNIFDVVGIGELEKFEYRINNETGNRILKLFFKRTGQLIVLSSATDTDKKHWDSLNQRIDNIVKFLMDKKF